jgi:hypothetical protein
MQSVVPITTKVVSSNPTHGEVYLMQHYVIKVDGVYRQIGGFLMVLWSPPPIILTATIYKYNLFDLFIYIFKKVGIG